MGVDSALVNTRTKEWFDVRGFSRFSLEEVRAALASREATRQLVLQYTSRPGADARPDVTNAYRDWLTLKLYEFSRRGGATPADIELCHDNDYTTELAWGDVVDKYRCVART
jgi:hypothetical protein